MGWGGYSSTNGSWSVSDAAQGGYSGTVSGTLSVTAGTGTSCSWSVSVSHPNYNYFRIYLAIDGTCVKDEYVKISNTKSSYFSGTATISGDDVSIKFGLSASVNSTSTSYMSFVEGTLTRNSWYWDNNTVSAPTITNHKNGKFSISATAGVAGANNGVTSSTLKYKIGGDDWRTATGLSVSNASLTCGRSTASQVIKAKTEVVGTYNSPTASATDVTVQNYLAPSLPGTISISPIPETKTRFTVRDNWTLSWGAASRANASSDIVGYRVRMYVKKAGEDFFATTPIKNSSGNNLSGVGNYYGTDYYCDVSASTTSLTIYPAKQPASYNSGERKLEAGDTIKFQIHARAIDGNSANLWSYDSNNQGRWSSERTIQNAGVMRVRVDNEWKEGIVKVKADDGSWKEADTVQVKKTDGTWGISS